MKFLSIDGPKCLELAGDAVLVSAHVLFLSRRGSLFSLDLELRQTMEAEPGIVTIVQLVYCGRAIDHADVFAVSRLFEAGLVTERHVIANGSPLQRPGFWFEVTGNEITAEVLHKLLTEQQFEIVFVCAETRAE